MTELVIKDKGLAATAAITNDEEVRNSATFLVPAQPPIKQMHRVPPPPPIPIPFLCAPYHLRVR